MRFLASFLALLLLAVCLLLFAASDSVPLVVRDETISPGAIAQARQIFEANDPRRLHRGEARQIAIPAALIDEGVNYLASRSLHGRGALIMSEGAAEVRLTLHLIDRPMPRYVNLRASIREAKGEPEGEPGIASAYIGRVPIPAAWVAFALASAVRAAGYGREWKLARGAINRLAINSASQTFVVNYAWEPALLEQARAIALQPDDLASIQAAQSALAAILDHHATGARVALTSVLKALLTVPGDPVREQRRAALLVLATYLAEQNLATIIPEARQWPRPRPVRLMLLNRYDSAQHFAISAALAAWAGEPLADAIGLYKELDDARHGSGFSFADLAADRAGTRFGNLVAQDAEVLIRSLENNVADTDLAPSLKGLPEYLSEREFQRKFGGPGDPAYQQVAAEIERRLAALPLYR